MDRPELREKEIDKLLEGLRDETQANLLEHQPPPIIHLYRRRILALIPDTEQIDAMLVEARRTAKHKERVRILGQIGKFRISDDSEVTSDYSTVIAISKGQWQALKEEK